MRLSISHNTDYHYSEPQRMIVQSHRLYPSEYPGQKVLSWNIDVSEANFGSYFYDGAGDRIRTMSISAVDSVQIKVSGEIETADTNGVVVYDKDRIAPLAYMRTSEATAPGEKLKEAARVSIAAANSNHLDQAHAMAEYIHGAIAYSTGSTNNASTAEQALEQGSGVCQDHAHCLIAIARLNKIPARYVTGYLHTDAQGESHDATHAWAELYIQGLGWVGFDSTNACCPDERYIRIGCGIDAQNAALIRGISRGVGQESMDVFVKIDGAQ